MKKKKENPVISEEEKAVAAPVETQVVVDDKSEAPNKPVESIVVEKPSPDDVPYWESIDSYRKEIAESMKRSKLRSTISMICIVACSIAGFILLSMNKLVTNIIAWSLLGIAFVIIIVFFILNRRIDRPDFMGFVVKASSDINKVTFADGRFTNCVYYPKDKLELGDVFAEGVYSGLTNSVSRNVVDGLFDEHHFRVCECALFTGAGRQRKTAFVGKYISFTNSLSFEGRFVILSRGKDQVDAPTDLDDLEPLEGSDDFIIYGPKGVDFKAILGTKFISKLKDFKIEKHLLNMIICVWAGKTSAYLSYDDLVNELPVDKKLNPDGLKQYQKELPLLLEALAEIAK